MKFRNVISGPIFCADAPDVVIETADAAGIDVRLSISGFVWQFALSPVAEQSGYVATIKTRDILEALIEPSSIGSGGVSGVPVVEISAGADTESSISMSFLALYGSAAGKTPADMARHWLTWRDQISATYFGCRERLTFLAGLDLLGWKSGSYTVAVKIYTPSGIVQATLASGTIPSQVSYISADASPASVLAVGEVSNILAYDLSFSLSGTAADDTAATVESYPLRLVLGAADPRAKEFIYINSLGVEDRVTACGIRKDGLEGGSSKFVNGGVEREHGNEAQEQFEVYSGHLATARSVEQWMEFLKSSERYLSSGGLKGIVIDDYNTEVQEGELCSVSFTYRLSERIKGFHHDDSESIGEYDPTQKYGALVVGDVPDAANPPAEDLFFLKTRLDEFPLVSLSEDYLLLVQSPVSYHWGAASLDSVKNWIQKTIDHNGISLAAVWASLSKTVPDTYANELISEDHIPVLPQSKVDGLAESLAALKTLIGGKADSSQLADYVLKSTYDTGMSGKLDKSVFDKLFTVHYKEGSATEIESLELNYGTWTTGFLSARGLDDTTGSGSGGTDLPAVWESLTKNVLPYQDVTINTAHIPTLPQSKVTGLPDALSSLRASYTGISALIPQAATADNQLADKEFVNSSIATATATFRGTFATLAALEATSADRNDYAFWAHKDEDGNTCYDKYTYDGSAWKFEYRLNNSSFTAAQWGAINSGITDTLVTKLSGIATGAQVNVIETVKLGGTALAVSGKAVDIIGTGIKSALGISDWALAASKPSYTTKEVTENTNLYYTDARVKAYADTLYLGKSATAAAATKLANSRKLWGNAFNGMADVNGDITLGSGKRIYFGSTSYYIELVNGNIHTNVGLYSDKFISARSVDPDAGGGSGASLPVVWASLQGNTDDYKDKTIHQAHIPTLPVSRIDGLATALADKQPLITADSKLDYSLLKNTPTIGNGTVTIKQNGTSKGSFTMNQTGGATINLADTTYSSLSAASGGTAVSLVTTGEKYTWNNKQAAISDLATIRSNAANGATAHGWGDHSKAGYITGITKAMVESVLTGNITSHTHTFDSLTSKPTTLGGYGIEDWIVKTSTASPDTLKTAGNYKVATVGTSGNGYNFNYGQVLVLRGTTSSDTIAQIAVPYSGSNLYFRSGLVSNFTDAAHPWWTIYTSGNCNNTSIVWSAKRLATPDNLICPYTWQQNSNATGTIVLSLPYSFNSMMQCIELTLYDYTTTPGYRGATKFIINGYNYSATSSSWVNPMVFRIGNTNVNVRVGHYKNTCCILIGSTDSTWLYPRLCVDKLYGSFSNHADSFKDNDWSCTILQDESEISNIVTAKDTPLYAPCYTRAGLPYVTDNDVSNKYLKLAGGTITGLLTITANANYGLTVNSILENSTAAGISFQIDGTTYGRVLVKDTNELSYYDMTKIHKVYHSGNSNLSTVPWNCSSLTAKDDVTAKAGLYGQYLEFSNIGSSAGHGGFIDFHFNGSTEDYTSRIIEDASGQLTLRASINVTGDISTAGWCKATNGFYGTNGVYFRQVGSIGEISIKNNNEFCWGSRTTTLYFNYREATNGKTVLNYIWNAGSSSTYATHTMGSLTVLGVAHATTGIYSDGYVSARGQDTSSDIRLKMDFRPLDGALEYIRGTHFTRFRWKDGSGESVGIIAQEERDREYGFLVRSHGEIGHLTYDYAASTALLGAALQEEDDKVEALKRRVKELENELDRLKQSNYAN